MQSVSTQPVSSTGRSAAPKCRQPSRDLSRVLPPPRTRLQQQRQRPLSRKRKRPQACPLQRRWPDRLAFVARNPSSLAGWRFLPIEVLPSGWLSTGWPSTGWLSTERLPGEFRSAGSEVDGFVHGRTRRTASDGTLPVEADADTDLWMTSNTASGKAAREPDDAVESASAWVTVGHVRGAFGVQGEVRVAPVSSVDQTVLHSVGSWRVRHGADFDFEFEARSVRVHGELLIASLKPHQSREELEALKGAEVQVRRDAFPEAGPDEYYWSDLIGCNVVDPGGALLGRVAGLDDHGAQLVLRLEDGLLIPFVPAHVLEVDCNARRIVADWSADWR